jgi:hypothetical protein
MNIARTLQEHYDDRLKTLAGQQCENIAVAMLIYTIRTMAWNKDL